MLELDDIQHLVFSGYSHLNYLRLQFLTIRDADAAREWLRRVAPLVPGSARRRPGDEKPDERVHVAFTAGGLLKLGLPETAIESFPREFSMGMSHPERSRKLGDHDSSAPQNWDFGGPQGEPIDAVLLLYARSETHLATLAGRVAGRAEAFSEAYLHDSVRRDAREPFGFRDGISQPAIAGSPVDVQAGQDVLKPGEFVLGYENEYGVEPLMPNVAANSDRMQLLATDPGNSSRRQFGRNGAYLVIRKLAQDVSAFWTFVDSASRGSDGAPDETARDLLAAKMMGRWPSGTPLVLAPDHDDPALGGDYTRNNSFKFMDRDPDGYACPFGSHVRRANPRDSLLFPPNPKLSSLSANRHRIIRRGRAYVEPPGSRSNPAQGIFFIAINADIGRQFELIQQSWLNHPRFNGLFDEKDPIVGDNDAGGTFSIQASPFRRRLHGIPRFVTVRGGGYFFMPGLKAIRYLANLGSP